MKALITGASAGIGRDMARVLCGMGYDLILVARRRERLEQLQQELSCSCRVIACDLSVPQNCIDLYEQTRAEAPDIVINNAGLGLFGRFDSTDLERELQMLRTDIVATHILTKLFLQEFLKRGSGYLLNVASSAAFAPGPLLSSYYAAKAYVLRLTQAVAEEVRHTGVYVGVLCPGPVDTEFNEVANVRFAIRGLDSAYVARYAVRKMFARRAVIVPGWKMKVAHIGSKLLPDRLLSKATYRFQKKKQ